MQSKTAETIKGGVIATTVMTLMMMVAPMMGKSR